MDAPERTRGFYPTDFRDLKAVTAAGAARPYPPERRAAVVAIIRRQAERFGIEEASREALDRLARPDALAVVAGQQPVLFGGPLYTLYKAITAARFARDLERACGRPVVPVFWIASDDHDFEEVRRIRLSDGAPEPEALEYPDGLAPRGISVARLQLDPAIGAVLDSAASLLPASEFREPLLERLRDAYRPGRSWGDAFARWVGPWLAPLGILLVDPADPEAKRIVLPVFEREIELGGRSAVAARETGAALVAAGYHAQIARAGDELNLFWHGERREAIRRAEGGRFRFAESGRTVSGEGLRAMARERPQDVSPGVLLRPVVQDYLFPTAAYVGGPAEVAYWAQVNAIYPLFDAAPPAIVPRGGATLLEAKVERVLDRFQLEWTRLAGDVEPVIGEVLRARLPEDFEDLFERERAGWAASFGRLRSAVASFDPSLASAVDTATGKVLHESATLERKLLQVWKRRQDETVQQIRRAAGHLFPLGALQERTVSAIGFVARYGPDLVSRLAPAVGAPGRHVLVPLGRLDP